MSRRKIGDYGGLLWIRIDLSMKNKGLLAKMGPAADKSGGFGTKHAGMVETMLENVWEDMMEM